MKLDRNLSNGMGKYALLKLRRLREMSSDTKRGLAYNAVLSALRVLEHEGILDLGDNQDAEFFVIRLKDLYAPLALNAYALAARRDDPEYAQEVAEMANRSGPRHPNVKRPD